MKNFVSKLFSNNKSLWIISIAISLALLILIVYQLDFRLLLRIITELNPYYLVIAVILLTLEGIMTALRILIFSTGAQKFYSALYTNAWYVFFLIFLPARLGEIAGNICIAKTYAAKSWSLNEEHHTSTLIRLDSFMFNIYFTHHFFL